MNTKEHLARHERHDREIAEIRAIQKRNEESIAQFTVCTRESIGQLTARTEESIADLAAVHAKEKAEIWVLMGKLARGTEAAQDEIREIRNGIRELTAAQKRTDAVLRSFIASLRGSNGHRKRGLS